VICFKVKHAIFVPFFIDWMRSPSEYDFLILIAQYLKAITGFEQVTDFIEAG